MFVRNCWYVAGWSHELGSEGPIGRSLIGEPIVLYRKEDGTPVAFEDRCCHRFAPLSLGRKEGDDLRCMYHGLKFDPAGRCIEIPGQDHVPKSACVRTYPVVERASWLWVWMGEAAAADPELIPQAVGLEDPDWTLRCGQLDYAANYQLINDNLADFSHLSYVHANSFGATEAWARSRPKVERLARGIRVSRWMSDGVREDAVLNRKGPGGAGTESYQTYDFLAPGILLMRTRIYPVGSEARSEGGEPAADLKPINDSFTSQAVTPTSEKTSRYFFSWGPRSGAGSEAKADLMLKVAQMAFGEDKVMIEAQQRIIDTTPARKEVLTSADVGPTQFRSVIERLIRAEQEGVVAA